MKQIESIYMARIPGGAHFLFVNNVCERAEADAKIKVGAKAELEALRATRDEEDAALALSRKSLLSDTIREADKRREQLYITLRNIAKAYRTFPVEAEAAAARRLVQLLKDYAINPRMQRDAETGLMVHLLDDLSGRCAADVATLRLGPLVEALKAVTARTLVVAVDSDRLFFPEQVWQMAAGISGAFYREIHSDHGHDGFLIEHDQLTALLDEFLNERIPSRASSFA